MSIPPHIRMSATDLARIETLWIEYEALLGSATRTEEEMPDHD